MRYTRRIEELQEEALSICKLICSVCDKYELPYYIGAGTLLGAVRHKGFIPWDDDMDIELTMEDYEKLVEILPKEFGTLLVLQNYKSDKCFPFPFTKVFLRNEITEKTFYPERNRSGNAFVDIFPLSNCPTNEQCTRKYFKAVQLITVAIASRSLPEGKAACGYTKWYAKALFMVVRIFPNQFLQKLCVAVVKYFHRHSSGELLGYAGGRYGYPHEVYLGVWYQDSVKKEFCGYAFSAPVGWDELLRHKYGDYWKLPDENNRTGHF